MRQLLITILFCLTATYNQVFPTYIIYTDEDEFLAQEIRLALDRFRLKPEFKLAPWNKRPPALQKQAEGFVFGDNADQKSYAKKFNATWHKESLLEYLTNNSLQLDKFTIQPLIIHPEVTLYSKLIPLEQVNYAQCYNDLLEKVNLKQKPQSSLNPLSYRSTCLIKSQGLNLYMIHSNPNSVSKLVEYKLSRWENAFSNDFKLFIESSIDIEISLPGNEDLLASPFFNRSSAGTNSPYKTDTDKAGLNTISILSLDKPVESINLSLYRNGHLLDKVSYKAADDPIPVFFFMLPLFFPAALYGKKFWIRKQSTARDRSRHRLPEGATLDKSVLPKVFQLFMKDFKLLNIEGQLHCAGKSTIAELLETWRKQGIDLKINEESYKEKNGADNRSLNLTFKINK